MHIEEVLRAAIMAREPVALSYDGGATRVVHPHALYWTSKQQLCVDCYQVDGPTSSGPLPGWRPFSVAKITSVGRLGGEFEIAPGFNAVSPKYKNGLVAVAQP